MITEVEDYFEKGCGRCKRFDTPDCSVRLWTSGVMELRRICREAGLQETVKWGHPCYTHHGRNIALIGAFRGDFTLAFMNASLLRDSHGVLQAQGRNSPSAGTLRFVDTAQVTALEPVIRAYLAELIGYAEAGVKPVKSPVNFELPDELVAALDADPELAEAFAALTPGRQRSYAILIEAAKAPATRYARIARSRDKIIAGKGALER